MDELLISSWQHVYKGNFSDKCASSAKYITQYRDYIYVDEPCELPQIIGDDLVAACIGYKPSASGMDGIPPQDFAFFNAKGMGWIASILNCIEQGAQWPSDSLHIAAHPEDSLSPMAYRILLVTPSIYRFWGRMRLRHLATWSSKWYLKDMFAGVSGASALDAGYLTALEHEHHALTHTNFCGGTLDLFKCFDQVQKPLLTSLLLLACFPVQVLAAYHRYHQIAQVYHVINGQTGRPHHHECGIRQGCPFSMMFIGIYMSAWIMQMRSYGTTVKARTLADDLLLTTSGNRCLRLFAHTYNATMDQLTAMGGKLAPQKVTHFRLKPIALRVA